jgi:hypothetical protein
MHAAINLPLVSGQVPSPFGLAKTITEQRAKQQAKSTTTVGRNVRNAIWREPMSVDLPRHRIAEEGIFIALVEYSSKKYMLRYTAPAERLAPDVQYHLGLIINEEGAYALITLYREPSLEEEKARYVENKDLMRLDFTLRNLVQSHTGARPCALMVVVNAVEDLQKYTQVAMFTLSGSADPHKARKIPFTTTYLKDDPQTHQFTSNGSVVSFISENTINPSWDQSAVLAVPRSLVALPKAAVVFEFFRFEIVNSPEAFHDGKRVFFHGFASFNMSQVVTDPSRYGETLCYSMPVTAAELNAEALFHIDLTVRDSTSYLAELAERGSVPRPLTGASSSTDEEAMPQQLTATPQDPVIAPSPTSHVPPIFASAFSPPMPTTAPISVRYSHSVAPASIRDKASHSPDQVVFKTVQSQTPATFVTPSASAATVTTATAAPEPDPLLDDDTMRSSLSNRRPPGLSVSIPPPPAALHKVVAADVSPSPISPESTLSPDELAMTLSSADMTPTAAAAPLAQKG